MWSDESSDNPPDEEVGFIAVTQSSVGKGSSEGVKSMIGSNWHLPGSGVDRAYCPYAVTFIARPPPNQTVMFTALSFRNSDSDMGKEDMEKNTCLDLECETDCMTCQVRGALTTEALPPAPTQVDHLKEVRREKLEDKVEEGIGRFMPWMPTSSAGRHSRKRLTKELKDEVQRL